MDRGFYRFAKFVGALTILLLGGVFMQSNVKGEEWHAATGPLKTRWTDSVSPTNDHPEYPRPQMERSVWQNLNGLWEYAITPKDASWSGTADGHILVPFPVESALSGVMRSVSPDERVWYHRVFEVPSSWHRKRVLLHFGAVDWETNVWVNGKKIGTHRGGYDPFTFDITEALKSGGPQDLLVSVYDPTDGEEGGLQPHGKQTLHPGGIMYTPTTGIWQTVWLEPVPHTYISDLKIVPDIDHSQLHLTVFVNGPTTGYEVEAQATEQNSVVARGSGAPNAELTLTIPNEKLWSPDDPFLYGLTVTLRNSDGAVDRVKSYFGMRKISIGPDEKGITRILLNNRPIFQIGLLDQGFWPDGLYTAPSEAAMRYDLETIKRLGFNLLRKHVKVEPDVWYSLCDHLGILVWQDMPSAGRPANLDPEILARRDRQFEHELSAMIQTHWNHPCIIMWVPFNEGWGQFDTARIVSMIKELDPSRLVDNASGWTDERVGDVIDMHNYPGPGSPKPEPNRAAVLGEFGGLGFAVKGHTWSQKSWGYQGLPNREMLTLRYAQLLQKVWQLRDNPGLCAAVYTQLSDVETECNGIMTYDRAEIKMNPKIMTEVNQGKFDNVPPLPEPAVLTKTILWRYTTQRPGEGWFKPGFDDSGWKEGAAGFGTQGTPGAIVHTEWNTDDIWLRRTVDLKADLLKHPLLLLHHDEDVQVYINGVLAFEEPGFLTEYEVVPIRPEALKTLHPGPNLLAVHCHQTTGGQYVDVEFVGEGGGVEQTAHSR
jgi:hypothetical protein